MRAFHPKTGKPIQIIRTEAHIIKTQRHLLWYTKDLSGSRFFRWATIVTDYTIVNRCPQVDIVLINGDITEEAAQAWTTWIKSATAATQTLLIVSPAWMERLRLTANTSSLLVTTELYSRYPFLPDLQPTAPLDHWVTAIATLMRFNVLVSAIPITASFTGQIKIIAEDATDSVVPPIYLIQQYYVPEKALRDREIRKALEMNINCSYIDKVILLDEKQHTLPFKSPKLEEVVIGHRLQYIDVFRYIRRSVPKDALVVFANSDMYMDETLRHLYSIDMNRQFLSLLRYEVSADGPPKLFGPRPDSQDTWIVAAASVDFEPTEADFGFNFGVPGCDNTITISMLRRKFNIVNPALSIKTYHLHSSNLRNYNPGDVIDKPTFLYVEPTGIQEYTPIKDLKPYELPESVWSRKAPKTFDRQIRYVEQSTAETICSMMKRDTEYNYSISSPNTFNRGFGEHDNRLYKFTGTIFTMPAGVVCDFKHIYVGRHPKWFHEWSNVALTILTNTVHTPELAAIHFPASMADTAAKWFLHYLPQAIQLRQALNSRPEFIVPIHPDTQPALQMLKWPEKGQVTIIPYLADSQYVSETVYAVTPNSFHDVTQEHIQLLRGMLPDSEPTTRPLVVLSAERDSSQICSKDWCNQVETNIFHRRDRDRWDIHIVDADTPTQVRLSLLAKADLLIASSESEWEALDWCWVMKKGATIMEIMPDIKPRGDHIHLAGAAELRYILLGVKREPILQQRQHALEDIEKAIVEHMFKETLHAQVPKIALPVVVLPAGKALTGIHAHVGDTFREMVTIWQERGYCRLQMSEDTPYVWWNRIGDTLLYDRPTMRWWQPVSYRLAFFANAYPEKPTRRDNTWSFWPRSPKAVEAVVLSNKVLRSYEERKIASIFLGRIENGVQKERRTTHDWSKAVELFSMPVDSTGGPYKYTQSEYLDILTQSRFGLCLPGFGPKCNREIEYFATGAVPIVTPGVDMTHYRVPPKEGVHYLRASTPEEVIKLVNTTSKEKWIELSVAGRAWWRRFASAEGLFRFTWGIIEESSRTLEVFELMERQKA